MGFLLTKIFGAFFLGVTLILAMENSRNCADQNVVLLNVASYPKAAYGVALGLNHSPVLGRQLGVFAADFLRLETTEDTKDHKG